jgi:hypothetical protein
MVIVYNTENEEVNYQTLHLKKKQKTPAISGTFLK